MSEGKVTTEHREIQQWAEERGAVPAAVKSTRSEEDPGILRFDFPPRDTALAPLEWEDFFAKFDAEGLAFLYQERTADGQMSRFHKFVNRS